MSPWAPQLDDIADLVASMARRRSGTVAVVTLGIPHDAPAVEMARELEQALVNRGLIAIEVQVRRVSSRPPHLVSMELRR